MALTGFVFRVNRKFSSLLTTVLITPMSRMYLARCFFLPRLCFLIRSALARLSLLVFFRRLRKSACIRFRPSLFFPLLSAISEKYFPRSVPRSSCSLVAIISVQPRSIPMTAPIFLFFHTVGVRRLLMSTYPQYHVSAGAFLVFCFYLLGEGRFFSRAAAT